MQDRIFARLLGVTIALHLLFAVWPQIDIAVSRWFVQTDGRFWLAGHAATEDLRQFFWVASLTCAVMALAMLCCTAALGARAHTPWRLWAFVTALYVLGPGILANAVLKNHWGRARPADVTEFGGAYQFTPPFEMTDQCLRNCSFVSGEAAAAAVLALVLGVFLLNGAPRLWRNLIGLALAALFVWVSLQRVASGRHFLSDVIFAGLFMLLVARVLYLLLRVRSVRGAALLTGMRADLALVLRPVIPAATSFAADAKQWLARRQSVGSSGNR